MSDVQEPECVPIADKPWECSGLGNFDRYDCIDGKITFVEHNSTACGYIDPNVVVAMSESEPGIPVVPILGLIAIGLVWGYVVFAKRR